MTAPFREALAARAATAGLAFTRAQYEQFDIYYTLLSRWNRRLNLTALPLDGLQPSTLDRLILEPCVISRWFPKNAETWFDFGSGGGSPAIPLKILFPGVELTMVESRSRKAAFLREAVRALDLSDVDVVAGRIEDLHADPSNSADAVTMRAVKPSPEVSDAAARLLRSGGTWLILQSIGAIGTLPDDVFDRLAVTPILETSQLSLFRRR